MSLYPQPGEVLWKELLTKGAATGAIAALTGYLLFKDESIYIAGMKVPGSVALGVGAAAGSLLADLAHKYIMPHIPANQKYEQAEFAAISLVAASLSTYAVSSMFSNAPVGLSFGVGAGSYLSSDYLYHHIINKQEGGFIY